MKGISQLWLLQQKNISAIKTKSFQQIRRRQNDVIKYINGLQESITNLKKYQQKYYNANKKINQLQKDILPKKKRTRPTITDPDILQNLSEKKKQTNNRISRKNVSNTAEMIESKLDELNIKEQTKTIKKILKKEKYTEVKQEIDAAHLKEIKNQHNKEIKAMHDHPTKLKNYMIMRLSGSLRNYKATHLMCRYYRDKVGKLTRKTTKNGLLYGVSTSPTANRIAFKKMLKIAEMEKTDLVPLLFFFQAKNEDQKQPELPENQELTAIEYKLVKNVKEAVKKLEKKEYCYAAVRRNMLKYIYSYCVMNYSVEIAQKKIDKVPVTIQICLDGFPIQGNHRGKECIEVHMFDIFFFL